MTNAMNTGIYGRVNPGPGFGDEYSYTDDAVLTAAQDGAAINNAGAAKAIEITLPAAVAGMEFAIDRVALFPVTVIAGGTDTIASGAPGGVYVINSSTLTVFSCNADGAWRVSISGDVSGLYNVRDFGAVGDGVAEDSDAISAAISAINAAGIGTLWLPPDMIFKVSSPLTTFTVPFGIAGRGKIKSYVTGGGAVLSVAPDVQFWALNDFTMTSDYYYDNYLTGASNAQDCVGLSVGAGTGTTYIWSVNNVTFRGMKVGAEVDGFIVTTANWHFRECETGLIVNNTAAAGAYDLGLRFENCRKDYSFTKCDALYLRQPLQEGVIATGQHVASTIDDCRSVVITAPYMEQSPVRNVPFLTVGGTTRCQYVELTGGVVVGTDVDVVPILFDRVSGGKVALTGPGSAAHMMFDTTENTGDVDVIYPKTRGVWPLDTSKTLGPMYNYFPNPTFDCWFRGWYDVGFSAVTMTKETSLVRRGQNAVRITASSTGPHNFLQFVLSGNGTTVASPSVLALRGKTIMIGAWVWVPDLPEFASTDPSGTELCLTHLRATSDTDGAGTGLVDSITTNGGTANHSAIKNAWNFLWTKLAIPAAATNIKIQVYLNNGGTLPDLDSYIVIDSLQIVEDKVPFSRFVAGEIAAEAPCIDASCRGGRVTMYTDTTTLADAAQTYVVGDEIQHLTPVVGGPRARTVTTGGAGGGTAALTAWANL